MTATATMAARSRTATAGHHVPPIALGLVAALGSAVGLSGLGDAPDPHATAASTARYFVENRDAMLGAAPFGYIGAAALLALAVLLARRLRDDGEDGAASAVVIGGAVTAGYLAGAQVLWTALAYQVAEASDDAAKGLFVLTILAVPVLAAGVATMVAGAAWSTRRSSVLPRWLGIVSAVAAVAAALGVVSFGDSGLFSPDVQQQVAGDIALLWPMVLGITLGVRARRASRG